MTQEFNVVSPEMWNDERFAELSDAGRLLWLRLLTGPEVTNVPGVLVIGRAALAEAMGWSPKKLVQVFKEFDLTDETHPDPMAIADWDSRVIWLPRACVHRRRPKNPNQVTAWRDAWRVIPKCGLKRRASEAINEFLRPLGASFLDAFAALDGQKGTKSEPKLPINNEVGAETNAPCSSVTTDKPITVDPALAHARAISPSLSPSNSSGSDPTCQVGRPPELPAPATAPDTPTPQTKPSARVINVGTAASLEACEIFVATLAESGWNRGAVRERWEVQILCDAINVHLRADGTLAGALAELRRAVREWTTALQDAAHFTSGWGARKFNEWLATGRRPVALRKPAAAAPPSRRAPAVLPELK